MRWQLFTVLVPMWTVLSQDSVEPRHEKVTVMGRTSYVYRPRLTYNTGRVPAVFVLHGSDSVAEDMFDVGFEQFADVHNFLVVYPEMHVPRSAKWGFHDDIPYFDALSKRLQAEDYGMDGSRAFVCGHSAGGTMSLFLQNEADTFSAAAAVEAAPGSLELWNMSRVGKRTMVVWNHADPVLAEYAPEQDESEYYNMTIDVLRRHGTRKPMASERLPLSVRTVSADVHTYEEDLAPELVMLSWRSWPGTHSWPTAWEFSFDAAHVLTKFFLRVSESQPLVMYA
eukprot:TRINITY_DN2901_c0_g1_i1.p1 TRINITY_DN2901_c0_g1~~TRINITY_DN2901_c0_g1_i1.p1  ORF type:complete len:282 (+),score=23.04 TRINITY_DN2901_c0_g1_i1:254-1099(+)